MKTCKNVRLFMKLSVEYYCISKINCIPPAFCIAIANKRKVVIPDTLPIGLYY